MIANVYRSGCGRTGRRRIYVPVWHGVTMSSVRRFVFVFLLGGLSAAAAGAEPAAGQASLSSDLGQLTLRQAEIFFGECGRSLELVQWTPENHDADVMIVGKLLSSLVEEVCMNRGECPRLPSDRDDGRSAGQ